MTDWTHLKSGSDVRGVAVAQPGVPATLTEDIGNALGQAFAAWLARRLNKPVETLTIAVGRDSRVSGEALAAAITQGLSAASAHVLDCGLCTTPSMFMSTVLLGADGAVMVTASHLPWQRNGYKFFTPEGGLEGSDIEDLLQEASVLPPISAGAGPERADLLNRYTAYLMDKARQALGGDRPLSGLHVIVDAGNGAGGFYARMLTQLGADTTGSQFLEPDGMFPGHTPNPEDADAMRSISKAVVNAKADLGVIFDADCDRAALVDAAGEAINRNRLIALVSAMLLRETPGSTIVTDSVTSAGLEDFVAAHGGVLHRFRRGYRHVIDEAKRLNAQGIDCPLAMETSGHAALRENRFLDDGMYLATRLIIEAQRLSRDGKTLTGMIVSLREPQDAVELRLPVTADDDALSAGQYALDAIAAAAKKDPNTAIDPKNQEGVRVLFGESSSWCLVRMSLHDPLLVINAESDVREGTRPMLDWLRETLESIADIDCTALAARMMPT